MMKEEKKRIRRDVLAVRDALPREAVAEMSQRICRHFSRLPLVENCHSVMIFLGFGSEVDTDYIIRWLWQENKRVLVPLCIPKTREMVIYPITDFVDLEPGYMGIREPKRDLPAAGKEEIDLVVVPAVAFDRRGYRVGYGGGYYDRFLAGMDVPTVGLAFSCQMIPEAPKGPYDQAVEGILTEQGYAVTNPNRRGATGSGSFAC